MNEYQITFINMQDELAAYSIEAESLADAVEKAESNTEDGDILIAVELLS